VPDQPLSPVQLGSKIEVSFEQHNDPKLSMIEQLGFFQASNNIMIRSFSMTGQLGFFQNRIDAAALTL
jgi:hypothetical protein